MVEQSDIASFAAFKKGSKGNELVYCWPESFNKDIPPPRSSNGATKSTNGRRPPPPLPPSNGNGNHNGYGSNGNRSNLHSNGY